MQGLDIKDQPHRMRLEADRLRGLIGAIYERNTRVGMTLRGAVREVEREQREYKLEYQNMFPTQDSRLAYRQYRSHVEAVLPAVEIAFGD